MVSRIDAPDCEPGPLPCDDKAPAPDIAEADATGDKAGGGADMPDRRQALAKMSGLAAYVGPAMTVLVTGPASAHHKVWHNANCRNFPSSPYCQSPA